MMGSGAIVFPLVTTLLLASQYKVVAGSSRSRKPINIVHVVADGENSIPCSPIHPHMAC